MPLKAQYRQKKNFSFHSIMSRCAIVLVVLVSYFTVVNGACQSTQKYFISCTTSRSLANAIQMCNQYGMKLINLTNSSTLAADVAELNSSMVSNNCNANFWFSSGNTTGYVASISTLGGILTNLLAGVGLLLGAVLESLSCLILLCPFTTTPPPITNAMVICVRPIQQRVIEKCQLTSLRTNMRIFKFREQPMYGGILDVFPSNSRMACSGQCSSNNDCTGISFIDGICSLYM